MSCLEIISNVGLVFINYLFCCLTKIILVISVKKPLTAHELKAETQTMGSVLLLAIPWKRQRWIQTSPILHV